MIPWLSVVGTIMVLVGIVINLMVTDPFTRFKTINGGTYEDSKRWPLKRFAKIERCQRFLAKLAQVLMVVGTLAVLWGLILKK